LRHNTGTFVTANYLKACACNWLRYTRQSIVVACERAPARWIGIPDVVGVTPKRTVIEIEVKVTKADFRANAKKRVMQYREQLPWTRKPSQFYFLVPPTLVADVIGELPSGAGLLTTDTASRYVRLHDLRVVVPARVDRGAHRLSVRELAAVVKDMAGTLVSALAKLETNNQETP
jgi:hypothetical protein